jgi:hypothetical protein
LKCADEIQACKDFDSLHEIVKAKCQISGAGELYWYDTAFRIGISLRFFPEKSISTGERGMGQKLSGSTTVRMFWK